MLCVMERRLVYLHVSLLYVGGLRGKKKTTHLLLLLLLSLYALKCFHDGDAVATDNLKYA